jgi:hypothetical protein
MTQLPPTREDKLRILEESRRANTRSAYTGVASPVAGGRFAKALGEYTVGATPTVEYPPLPDGSPWRQQQPPPEEPLGFSVEDMPVMGEPFEAERAYLISAATSLSSGDGDAEVTPPSAKADPVPPLLPGSAASAPLTEPPAVGGADPSLGSTGPSFARDQQLAAGSSPSTPTSPPPLDVAAARPVAGSPPFSNSAQPSIAQPFGEGRTRRKELSKAGSFRRFG